MLLTLCGTQFLGNGGLTTGDAINSMYTINNNDGGDLSDVGSALSKIDGGIIGYIGSNWGVMLQAISRTTGSNILSTPSIMTLDNQEASFLVGDEVPVLTGSTSSSDNDNPFQTIERKDIGVKLNVTPQINEGDSVQLLIEQEVSSIKDSTNTVDVVFSTRSIKTTVLVKSGQTIVLGGLIDDKVIESVDKVPILGDIPWLGNLFKSTISTTEKRNLMIFLRATIIRDEDTMNKLSMRKYSLIRAMQKTQRDIGINLMPSEKAPILPKWKKSKKVDVKDFVKKGKSLKPGDDNA
ncbi:type II secretion system protein GspD [Psychromonas sp. CD1]|nr:hypothetical protein [Psychromonas sp. CD1]